MAIRIDQLETWMLGAPAGLLSKDHHAGWNFTYGAHARADVALTMPRSHRTYASTAILPPFDQQIPEMDLGVFSPTLWKEIQPDEMGLLLVAGNRRLGRLQYARPGQTPTQSRGIVLRTDELAAIDNGEEYLLQVLADLAYVPGISGMQPKTLATVGDLDFVSAGIDTHILKGNHRDYPWATLVEHLSLNAASACGLSVPKHQLSADGRLLAVERFDIHDGTVLGFDEACALLGLLSAQKYEGSYERMGSHLLRFISRQARLDNAITLLKQLAFCYAIENGDAHLKNFGLLYEDGTDAQLSPAYDLLTTSCFPKLKHDRPALTLGGRKVWDAFGELERYFVRTLAVPASTARQTLAEVLEGVRRSTPHISIMGERFAEAATVLTAAEQAWIRGTQRLEAHLSKAK